MTRNPGLPFDAAAIEALHVDDSEIERDIAAFTAHPLPEGRERANWLLEAIACMDLTTLAGDDTPERVEQLCARARAPLPPTLLQALGLAPGMLKTGAVCVYHAMIAPALTALAGSDIPVAAVSAGFPAGLSPLSTRIAEVTESAAAGAAEIDIVIQRRHALSGDWRTLYDEVRAFREAAGQAHVKAILATGELGTATRIARASLVCIMAGADFIKTSTGMEKVNATLPAGLVMLRIIRDHATRTGIRIGFKPAGGIASADQALAWLMLVRQELGEEWLTPDLFRFGASRLLDDVERHLEAHVAA
ncbi:deoxyribose-phosphate aldolase [Sphingomonas oleivorans]|uniref:Deoxyribose-phosphate aldolase n=1 Tax=Sphingomonas oleivorans TaxID=1735121 RepID=A0A2T5G1N9_9SPHN|nr:deoxyribose-phosphate aldolase [Sphingomonas oleivorans]PTQ13079.1 deoxyribose-phosphate aldolase [Sphingomonas oleivorans]